MDTYRNKPTADQLLHDLMRIMAPVPVGEGGKFAIVGHGPGTAPETVVGPIQRVTRAVEDFTFEEQTQISLGTSPNGDAQMSVYFEEEHKGWTAICEELRALGVEINDQDKLTALLRLWGERLVTLRYNQGRSTMQECLDMALVNAKPFQAPFPHDPDA